MPPSTPAVEPVTVRAGDTIAWSRRLPDYPAGEGWALAYILLGDNAPRITLNSSADGDDHAIAVPASESAGWPPGRYAWQARVSKDGAVYTVGTGALEVLPDLSADTLTSFDARSHARKMLEAIEAALESRASAGQLAVLEYEIAGRRMKFDTATLIKMRAEYTAEVAREDAANAGKSGRGRVLLRF